MPSRVPDQVLSEAIYSSVQDGVYPDNEEVVSAELPSSALQTLCQLLDKACGDVKTSIRELGRLSATDIDGWIAQAKQLRGDIGDSETIAKEIVALGEKGVQSENNAKDSASKVLLLKNELAFNDSLSVTLQRVQVFKQTVEDAQEATIAARLRDAGSLLQRAQHQAANLQPYENTVSAGLLQVKISDIKKTLTDTVTLHWNKLVLVEPDKSRVTIRNQIEDDPKVDLMTVEVALEALDIQKPRVIELKMNLDSVIFTPLLLPQGNGHMGVLEIDGNTIRILAKKSKSTIEDLLADTHSIMEWLASHLPRQITNQVFEILLPNLISRLVSGPLSNAVPPDLTGITEFKTTLRIVEKFAESLERRNWPGSAALVAWTTDAPKVWFARRSNSSLHSIRQLLVRGIGKPRAVERVETQTVAGEDDVFQISATKDNWDASWSDEEENKNNTIPNANPAPERSSADLGADEEAVDAWGLGEDDEGEETASASQGAAEDADVNDDGGESWGWGNENDDTELPGREQPINAVGARNSKAHQGKQLAEREVTLRETYYITALPEQIFEIIIQAIDDAGRLEGKDGSSNPVAPAAAGLYSLPGVLLTMYRAIAPNFYGHDINGNMFLYNDSLYLAEQLRLFAAHHKSQSQGGLLTEIFDIEDDVAVLELFGKRAYGKEMESERTILGDMLDGAQGFANCTEHPYAQECDLAINSTVDRLRIIHGQWECVLSPSALFQSIGSLLSTIINKIMVDIEDMSDISEPESQRLAALCKKIMALENLFLQESTPPIGNEDQKSTIAAAIYTRGWWKFQYLSEILESSLADIKYLWTEGELSLEFTGDEVVDLIEALFADSDYRKRAIGEIRRVGRRV